MIVRQAEVHQQRDGDRAWTTPGDTGGLTQFGAYVDTLQPGAAPRDPHWHEREDEFVHVLSGELTVIEDGAEHTLRPGDSACWAAGVPVAHTVANRSAAPCSFLIVGTRVTHDVCHYPASGQVLHTEGEHWRIEDRDGQVLRSGRCKSPPGRD